MKVIIPIILLISILGVYFLFKEDSKIALTHKHSKKNGTPNYRLVSYVDALSSYWGAHPVAEAIGVPGYSIPTKYNVLILSFLLTYGAADAASVWANPFGFMDKASCPFGQTVPDV